MKDEKHYNRTAQSHHSSRLFRPLIEVRIRVLHLLFEPKIRHSQQRIGCAKGLGITEF